MRCAGSISQRVERIEDRGTSIQDAFYVARARSEILKPRMTSPEGFQQR